MKKPRITLKQLAVLSPVLLAAALRWSCLRLAETGVACRPGDRRAGGEPSACLPVWAVPALRRLCGRPAPVHVLPALFALDRGFVLTAPQYLLCPLYAQLCTGRPIRLFCRSPVDLQTKSLLSPGCAFFCQAGCGKIVSDPRRKRGRNKNRERGSWASRVPAARPKMHRPQAGLFPDFVTPMSAPAQSPIAASGRGRTPNFQARRAAPQRPPPSLPFPASFPILHRKERCP